ncbi:N-acetylmuramoyl-L-alanine amidase [Acetivibrio straminisolvens JCM 21531]|uniref:N-acetylmuramoyl-L-alanine amidase n=2 Tax=Acetivibrio straminisolvens TaxID=253314 RepID=W4VBA0_9FIRM|nr:N-acetylmuramoyl-L-alanine amidase [Acetivibrio straminisolvens JCM 21531]
MQKIKILVWPKKNVYFCLALVILLILLITLISLQFRIMEDTFDATGKTIVIDPGHGGIDGGTHTDRLLEKDINLEVSKKLRNLLTDMGYQVILTRDEDIALDHLSDTGKNRHQRDLNARVQIINNSNAQLFLSIHVNCNFKNPSASGSIVFYGDRFSENKELAYAIQRALNAIEINGKKRTVHDPVLSNRYYLLNHSKIPGAIVEVAFISNTTECRMLEGSAFRDELAKAIAEGVSKYLIQLEKTKSN